MTVDLRDVNVTHVAILSEARHRKICSAFACVSYLYALVKGVINYRVDERPKYSDVIMTQ